MMLVLTPNAVCKLTKILVNASSDTLSRMQTVVWQSKFLDLKSLTIFEKHFFNCLLYVREITCIIYKREKE